MTGVDRLAKPMTAAPQPRSSLDRAEFERLALQHAPRARRFAFAYLGDRDRAEEIVQEGLARLYERRGEYPLTIHFGPYLVKTIARLCIDEKRARAAHERHGVARTEAVTPAASEDPAESAQRQETSQLLQQAMLKLPERERACLLLTVCEGLSYREVADALALSVSDVNNALYQARTTLRSTLGKQLLDEPGARPGIAGGAGA